MKEKLKLLLRWGIVFLGCFAVIYAIVFIGGWKLFESNDPILMEIGVALILSTFVFFIVEAFDRLDKRIKSLEETVKHLKSKNKE